MVIELHRPFLYEDTYAYVYRKNDVENFKTFKDQVQMNINKIKKLIDTDIEKLSDEGFYKLLNSVYYIKPEMSDYLEILSMNNNKKYKYTSKIQTTLTFTNIATEGYGRSFDWWEQLYQVEYVAAISSEMKFDPNKTYSKKEIEKLVSNKTIVLLEQIETPVEVTNMDFKKENFENDFVKDIDTRSKSFPENFDSYIPKLRKMFTKKKILLDISKYINAFKNDIQDVITNSDPNNEIASLCKQWYIDSNIGEQVKALQMQIKSKRNYV